MHKRKQHQTAALGTSRKPASFASAPVRAGRFHNLRTVVAAVAALAVLLTACGNGSTPTPAPTGDADRGRTVFTADAAPPCATCHAIDGVSTGQIGPDLSHIGSQAAERVADPGYTGAARDAAAYIRESIVNPNTFVAPDCPTGACFKDIMPQDFGQKLTEQQVSDLVAFLLSQQ